MPLPSRRKNEDKKKFVSRCVKFMSDKGEGEGRAQRVAICMSKANFFTDRQLEVIAKFVSAAIGDRRVIKDLSPPLKKKKKHKYRITKEDGSGTDV